MKRSMFYRFFPPPHFLVMPVVGFDVSDSSVRFIEVLETSKGCVVGRHGRQALTPGIVEGGEIKKPDEVHAILAAIQKKHNIEHVAVSLPEEQAYLVDIRLPVMTYGEIRGAIELVLEEYIPLKATEVVFDFDITAQDEKGFDVSVCVVPTTLVDSYVDIFRGTGMTIAALEVEAQSIARAVIPAGSLETVLVVDFGKMRTGVSIVSRGAVVFTSTIPLGGDSVTRMVSKHLCVPIEKAEVMKCEGEVASQDEALDMAIRSSVSVFRDEINKYYAYWQTHPDEEGKSHQPISKIYLCGGDANVRGLVRYLAAGFEVPVVLGNVFVNMNSLDTYIPPIAFSESLGYATAMGLALRRFG